MVISTETNFTVGSKQWRWLNADLAAVDRGITPFVIVAGHRPLYTSSLQEDKFGAGLIEHVQPVLLQHRVDVYLSGKSRAADYNQQSSSSILQLIFCFQVMFMRTSAHVS